MINLWILTEERPKIKVLKTILEKFIYDNSFVAFFDNIRIIPVLKDNKFTFVYELIGIRCNKIGKIYIKTVSGYSSFVDFLLFYQDNEPNTRDIPLYAIEETKTDDKESRNTGVYQRCTKFVFVEYYYPNIKKIMLYNQIEQKDKATDTYIFGTRLLMTLNVEILGKKLDNAIFKPFTSVDELIECKGKMRKAPKGNVPIQIIKESKEIITVSGRLIKSGSLSHDPNIGALSIICAVLRKLKWNDTIEIVKHGLEQRHINGKNKFTQIASKLNISLQKLTLPSSVKNNNEYWKYDYSGEKLGTIFIHLAVENFTSGYSIFENHAGCEKGYFYTKEGKHIPLQKYQDKIKYKAGDKEQIVYIPDLILIDIDNSEIINAEGKKYEFKQNGIMELNNYEYIEKYYILKYYKDFKIVRTVVLYGSNETQIVEVEVGFLLNYNGDLVLGIKAPKLFCIAIKNLLDFWG